jgi:hypothetical protein
VSEERPYAPARRHPLVDRFEDELIASEPVDYERNLRLFEAMWLQARAAGVIPGPDPLEGIDLKIRLLELLNAVRRPVEPGDARE